MKKLEIPKYVLDLLDYDLASDGMKEELEKKYVELQTGVGTWSGDSVTIRTIHDENKDLGMALLASAAGYTVIVAAPEKLNDGAQTILDSYSDYFTVFQGKDSMGQAMKKAKELTSGGANNKVVVVAYPGADGSEVLNENISE